MLSNRGSKKALEVKNQSESFARGLYGEAGAMRIPRAHELTMALYRHVHEQVTQAVSALWRIDD
jgi:hypothetical protein